MDFGHAVIPFARFLFQNVIRPDKLANNKTL